MTTVATKIELVTEAIETLTLAQVHLCSPAVTDHEREMAAKNLTDARDLLSRAFKELMTPTFRVIEGGASRDRSPVVQGNLA